MVNRVPACPDCGEPGVKVKGNHYRCPSCRAVWEEVGWTDVILREQAMLIESDRLKGINGLLAVIDEICDNCGRMIKHAEKYCYNTNELISTDNSLMFGKRGKMYCVKCSLLAGYMRMVRNVDTGKEYPVMYRLKDEEFID